MAWGQNSWFVFAYSTLSTVKQLLQGFGGLISFTDSTGRATRPRTEEVTDSTGLAKPAQRRQGSHTGSNGLAKPGQGRQGPLTDSTKLAKAAQRQQGSFTDSTELASQAEDGRGHLQIQLD